MPVQHLVLGGARSGKSRFAESTVNQLVAGTARERVYLATGRARDEEMAERIAHHQRQRRGVAWSVVEEPLDPAAVLSAATANQVILIDCLTLWLTNLYSDGAHDRWPEIRTGFISAVERCVADVVMVSNEIGFGVVPLGAETRWFVDEIGRLHQSLAEVCSHVTLVVAGLPVALKQPVASG